MPASSGSIQRRLSSDPSLQRGELNSHRVAGLIVVEDQRTPPTPDMLGHVVVVETDTDEVLVKRLLRGSQPHRFDLESIAGPTRQDARLRWAAHITAIIPPYQARKIIRSCAA